MLTERRIPRETTPIRSSTFVDTLIRTVAELSGSRSGAALSRETLGKCQEGAHALVYYLLQEPQSFENVAILACHNMPKEHTTGWLSHYGVLAKDRGGTWYATSPANYRPDEGPAERVSMGSSLSHVLGAYQKQEGGIWIAPEYVHEALSEASAPSRLDFDQKGNVHVATTALETDGCFMGTPLFMRIRPYVYRVEAA